MSAMRVSAARAADGKVQGRFFFSLPHRRCNDRSVQPCCSLIMGKWFVASRWLGLETGELLGLVVQRFSIKNRYSKE